MMKLPNLLTFLRILAVPLMIVALYVDTSAGRWWALVIFILASVTDFLDGYFARRMDLQSSLGALLDPLADKFLVLSALLMLIETRTISGIHVIVTIVILSREFLVAGLRQHLADNQVAMPVSQLAKWKTAAQMTAIGFLIAGPVGERILPLTMEVGLTLLWVSAALTVLTGYQYFLIGLRHLSEDNT